MTTQNLPARRRPTVFATITTLPPTARPAPATPTANHSAGTWYLLALTTGIFASAAAWEQMWLVAAMLGGLGVILAVAGWRTRRREHRQ